MSRKTPWKGRRRPLSDKPLGKVRIGQWTFDFGGRSPADYNKALHFAGDIEHAAKILAVLDLDRGLPLLDEDQRERVRAALTGIVEVTARLKEMNPTPGATARGSECSQDTPSCETGGDQDVGHRS